MLYEYVYNGYCNQHAHRDKYQQMLYEYKIWPSLIDSAKNDKYQQMLYEYHIMEFNRYISMININRCCTNTYYFSFAVIPVVR